VQSGTVEVMTVAPEVSVVMSVYNGAPSLRETMDSVLSQEGIDLELVVVNDGSTDATGEILAEYTSRDSRVNVLAQENQGLTRALIAGCAQGRGKYIARQDCGDVSLPGRFACQRDILNANPAAVMVSCATRFVGPSDEELYTIAQLSNELEEGLEQLTVEKIGPSHHGSTMFRRSTYKQVGGYRAEFPVGQDVDLWIRLSELGQCLAIPDVLYQAKWAPGSISATRRHEQIRAANSIRACAVARRAGKSEADVLRRWESELAALRAQLARARRRGMATERARFYYFVARTLRRTRPDRSRLYYWKSIRSRVLYAPAWAGLILPNWVDGSLKRIAVLIGRGE
jgi:glycosyltransferase involved in cell wall biosynthesis